MAGCIVEVKRYFHCYFDLDRFTVFDRWFEFPQLDRLDCRFVKIGTESLQNGDIEWITV